MSEKSASRPGSGGGFRRRSVLAAAGLAAVPAAVAGRASAEIVAPAPGTPASGERFRDQVVLVTGAARGIGRAVAVAFAREGADLVLVDLARPQGLSSVGYPLAGPDDLRATGQAVEEAGRRCATYEADVRDAERQRVIVAETVSTFSRLDVAVANAGILPRVPLDRTTDAVWDETVGVNLTGAGHTLRAAVPEMRRRGSGRIIVTASEFARHCIAPNRVAYTASKWGVLGLVKAAAMELSSTGITVNAVCPGFTRTGMTITDEVFRAVSPDDPTPAAAEQAILRQNTQRNAQPVAFVEPEDIAATVLFLSSAQARFITGAGFDVNAGFSPTVTA